MSLRPGSAAPLNRPAARWPSLTRRQTTSTNPARRYPGQPPPAVPAGHARWCGVVSSRVHSTQHAARPGGGCRRPALAGTQSARVSQSRSRAMPRLAPRSGRDAAWRKKRANGIHYKRPGPAPYLHRNPYGRHRCRCDRRGSGRHVRGVTCRIHVDGDDVVVTVGIAFRVAVASLHAPRGNQGLWREFADHPGAAVGAGSTRALGRPGNGATPPHARHLPAHRPPVGLPAQGRF